MAILSLRAAFSLAAFLAFASNASAQQISLPSGKSISCAQAKKYLNDSFQPGSDLLLPKSVADAQERRTAVLAETKKHIDVMKKDWDKKTTAQKKKMRDNLYWFLGSLVISQGSQKLLKAGNLSDIDKQYAEAALEKSLKSSELLVKAGFQKEITAEEVAVMPAGSIISMLGSAGKISGWWGLVLDGGLFGIDIATLYGDVYLTDQDFKGQIVELEKLADLVSKRLTETNKASFDAFKKKVKDTCP